MQHEIKKLTTPAEWGQAKALDDIAFGVGVGIVGISIAELKEISENGAVLGLYYQGLSYLLIAETQVITSPISDHSNLGKDEAFCYGTAVHPNHQNCGFAQVMYKAQEAVALEADKQKISLTVRLENAASIKARLKAGYQITAYHSNYYGKVEDGGARLWMAKDLTKPSTGYGGGGNMAKENVTISPEMGIDLPAHKLVADLLSHNYVGVGLAKSEGKFTLIFEKKI